ncbi:hypothetical protein LP420_39305 [Massilia sp. B-10]|nr:hypothetical protein LP420_39305 [Massilia sp. B-10]
MITDEAEDAINYTARYRLFGGGTGTRAAVYACFFGGFLLSLLTKLALRPVRRGRQFPRQPVQPPDQGRRAGDPPQADSRREEPVCLSIFWSVALVLTPYLYMGQRPGALALLTIAISFGLNYFVELAWDLRDMRGDRHAASAHGAAADRRSGDLRDPQPGAYRHLRPDPLGRLAGLAASHEGLGHGRAAVAVWPGLPGLVPQAGGQDLGFASLYRVCRGDSPGRHGRTNVRQNGRLKWRSIA